MGSCSVLRLDLAQPDLGPYKQEMKVHASGSWPELGPLMINDLCNNEFNQIISTEEEPSL